MSKVVVIGGGLSGLAAAYRLQQAGRTVTVLERAERTGGCAATVHQDGYVVDTGCNLINDSFVHYLALAEDLGLSDRVVTSSRVADFVRGSKAISVDPDRKFRLARNRLLSPPAKLAVLKGATRLYPKLRTLDPYALTNVAHAEDHGTGTEFCERYFNAEVGEYAIDPIVRSYAGTGLEEASGLSVLGALAVGLKALKAVQGGMAVLPAALTSRLDVRTGSEAFSVVDQGDGVSVVYRDSSGEHELDADECVLAISFHAALRLWPALGEAAPHLGAQLRDVGLISVALGYDAPSPTSAYAILVPTRESREVLGGFVEQNKSADRAPAGKTLLTLFTDAQVTGRFMKQSDDEIIDWASNYTEKLYPSIRGKRELAIVTRWPHTGYIPFPGYWQAIAEIRKNLPRGRVHVTSTLFGSGGIERAVLGGERTATRVLRAAA